MRLVCVRAEGLNPYYNQAIESALLELADDQTEVLYLWQNDKTVVIGKNQNAYVECKIPHIVADGGYVARRISGGGAVYHDKGNLNFTFLSSKKNFSIPKNFEIMMGAMRRLGFDAQLNGRNDVVIDGKKFSGNAFYKGNTCFHHGTVLIKTDKQMMSSYLNVPEVKLSAKGVKSVVSRVVNLSEIDSSVDADKVADALISEFGCYYGGEVEMLRPSELDQAKVQEQLKLFSDEKWQLMDNVYYDAQAVVRLSWGTADIRLKLSGSVIEKAKIYSDGLDVEEVQRKEQLLVGADLYKGKQDVDDILSAFKEQKNGF
ncbi:MAG: lipoate--protein ligase [Clostridia bacterium]|nr:lipoate--protein ligase [Clostridia bacterium]